MKLLGGTSRHQDEGCKTKWLVHCCHCLRIVLALIKGKLFINESRKLFKCYVLRRTHHFVPAMFGATLLLAETDQPLCVNGEVSVSIHYCMLPRVLLGVAGRRKEDRKTACS